MAVRPPLSLAPLSEVLAKDPQRKIKLFSVLQTKEEIFFPPSPSDFTLEEVNTELSGMPVGDSGRGRRREGEKEEERVERGG
jgi:hypothetical protein